MDDTPYADLSPDLIFDAVEAQGYTCDYRLIALNSYENRVYQIGIEESAPLVAKFYRPGRWSDDQILEEHRFTLALATEEIPVVAPLAGANASTLFHYHGHRFALFPRRGGRAPELDNLDHLEWLGRFLGRIHLLGGAAPFRYRPALDAESFGHEPARFLLNGTLLPAELAGRYRALTQRLLAIIEERFATIPWRSLRLHGDCHPGNILWTDQGPHFVDLDDCRSGPAVQDLWMLLSGERREMTLQLGVLLEGYETFRDFDRRELALIEPLRTLRIIHYAGWLARRWNDPAFPLAFPWFNTPAYWQQHLANLEQQLHALEAPPLHV